MLLAILAGTLTASAQQQEMKMTDSLPIDSAWRIGTLHNGMTYFVRHNNAQPGMANFYMVHNVGAIQEEDNQTGLAHFLEHMAFQGSKNFPGDRMLNFLEGLGLQFGTNLNAATGIESTQYFLQDVPVKRSSELDSLLLILHDWSGYLTLDPKRIDVERNVIVEEHRMRNTVDFRNQQRLAPWLYGNTRYSYRDLIGSDDFIRTFKPAQLQAFYKKWYRPDLQAVIIVGDIDADDVVERLKHIMADIPKPNNPIQKEQITIPGNAQPQVEFLADPDMLGLKAQLYIKRQAVPRDMNNNVGAYILRLTTQMMGVLTNMRFQDLQIQDGCPFASAILGDAPITETCDALELVVIPRGDDLGNAFSSTYGELERVRRLGFNADEFQMARTAMLQSEYRQFTNADKRHNADYGKECIDHFIKNMPLMSAHDRWNMAQRATANITLESLNKLASVLINQSNNFLAINTPEKTETPLPSADQLRQFFSWVRTADMQPYVKHTVNKPLLAEKPKAGKVTKTEKGKFGSTVYTLSNGSRVVAKHTNFQPGQVFITAQSNGGISLVSDKEFFAAGLIPQIVPASGVGGLTAEEITRLTANAGIGVMPRTERFGASLVGTASKRTLEQTLQLMYLYMTQPNFNGNLLSQMTEQMSSSLTEALKQPNLASNDALNKLINGDTFRSGLPSLDAVKGTTLDDLKSAYRKMFTENASNFTYYIVGDYDETTLPALIAQYVGSLSESKTKSENKSDGMTMQLGATEKTLSVPMGAEKAYVSMAWIGAEPYSQEGTAVMNQLAECLRIRCLGSLRQDKGGVYGVNLTGGMTQFPEPNYQLSVSFQTNPKRVQEMVNAVKTELEVIAQNGPQKDDMKKAIEFWRKQQPATMESNSYYYFFLQNYYENGLLWETDRTKVESFITSEAVQRLAKKIVSDGNLKVVTVLPAQ